MTAATDTAEQIAAHTPGPWGWFGNESGVYLATPDRGRTYVMGFRRMGLQGAQPTFRDGGVMRPASELVRFAVGAGEAKGFVAGRADRSVYRYDITSIDHPDARLIAAAPDGLAVAFAALDFLNAEYADAKSAALDGDPLAPEARPLRDQLCAFVAKAVSQ